MADPGEASQGSVEEQQERADLPNQTLVCRSLSRFVDHPRAFSLSTLLVKESIRGGLATVRFPKYTSTSDFFREPCCVSRATSPHALVSKFILQSSSKLFWPLGRGPRKNCKNDLDDQT